MKKKLRNILLIDDDSITNYLNKELIIETGITNTVTICSSGDEALIWFKQYNPASPLDRIDLILLDINMPGIDGFEFLEAFSKLNQNIPVVMLTTSDNVRDKSKANQFKVNGYINKPLSEEKLLNLFDSILV